MAIARPTPTGKEIKLDPKEHLVSKTDTAGVITYANRYFSKVCGYKESELVGAPHNIVRHPDMPKAVFYLMWEYLKNNRNIVAVVKNMAKNGDHYWVITDFDIKKDSHGRTKEYIAFRSAAPRKIIKAVEPIYEKMLEVEQEQGMEASYQFLLNYLEAKGVNYDQFIDQLAKPKGLFSKIKEIF